MERKRHFRRARFEKLEDRKLLAADVTDLTRVFWEATADRFAEQLQSVDNPVRFRLDSVDSNGKPISTVEKGKEFSLNVYVVDQRPQPLGVFAAYLDLEFDASKIKQMGDLVFGEWFTNATSRGTAVEGHLDEVGAVAQFLTPSHFSQFVESLDETLLFQAPFRAIEPGPVTFLASAADASRGSEVLLFGDNQPINQRQIQFDNVSLEVVPTAAPKQGSDLRIDINNLDTFDLRRFETRFSMLPAVTLEPVSRTPPLFDVWQYESQKTGFLTERWNRSDVTQSWLSIDKPLGEGYIRSAASAELDRDHNGFIELDVRSFGQSRTPFRSSTVPESLPFWGFLDMSTTRVLSQQSGSIVVPRDLARQVQRIAWEPRRNGAMDWNSAGSTVDMIDISEVAYETIRTQSWDERLQVLPMVARHDPTEMKRRGDSSAPQHMLDALFAMEVELKAARSTRQVIELIGNEDEEPGGSEDDTQRSCEEADAGPPHPGGKRVEKSPGNRSAQDA
jgi:hypothetical protein